MTNEMITSLFIFKPSLPKITNYGRQGAFNFKQPIYAKLNNSEKVVGFHNKAYF